MEEAVKVTLKVETMKVLTTTATAKKALMIMTAEKPPLLKNSPPNGVTLGGGTTLGSCVN